MKASSSARQERLAAALRENLKRRKAGARDAKGKAKPSAAAPPPDRPAPATKTDLR